MVAYYAGAWQNRDQIKILSLDSIPFKIPMNQDEIVQLFKKILTAKRANPAADVSALEAKIDPHYPTNSCGIVWVSLYYRLWKSW